MVLQGTGSSKRTCAAHVAQRDKDGTHRSNDPSASDAPTLQQKARGVVSAAAAAVLLSAGTPSVPARADSGGGAAPIVPLPPISSNAGAEAAAAGAALGAARSAATEAAAGAHLCHSTTCCFRVVCPPCIKYHASS